MQSITQEIKFITLPEPLQDYLIKAFTAVGDPTAVSYVEALLRRIFKEINPTIIITETRNKVTAKIAEACRDKIQAELKKVRNEIS